MKLKDLAVEHDYYAHDSNYYSNEPSEYYATWIGFYNEFKDADVDMNLVFRWDIKKAASTEEYYMKIIIIQQRKGIYKPIHIANVCEQDVEQIKSYLEPHFQKLLINWQPLSEIF